MASQKFIQLPSGLLLDLSQVELVAPTCGDEAYKRFVVRFKSGSELEIYEDRINMPTSHMKREVFVDHLLSQSDLLNK